MSMEGGSSMKNQRGAAMLTVILVLLILTALGVAVSLIMTQEDRTSSRQDLQKLALYAAEAGLRRGEAILANREILSINSMLGYQPTAAQAFQEVPGTPQQPNASDRSSWDAAHLGTYLLDGATELANIEIPLAAMAQGKRAFYSVYLRDNPDDPDPSPTVNKDSRVRLLAVGWVANSADPNASWAARGVAAVKILEEEFNWQGVSQAESTQKLVNTGGTGSGVVTSWQGLPNPV